MPLLESDRGEANPPSDSILARQVIDSILHDAKRSLAEDRSLVPMLFLQTANGKRVMSPLPLRASHQQKVVYFTRLGIALEREGVTISEAVLVSVKPYPTVLSDDISNPSPDRPEALVVVGRNAEKTRQSVVIQPFIRDLERVPLFGEMAVAQYNLTNNESHPRATGVLDYLFPLSSSRRRSGFE